MGILSEQITGSTINVIIDSSNLQSASYNTSTKTLSVTFKNETIYEYYDVPWELFTKFRMAESQGKFFSANISRAFNYKKLNGKKIVS